MSKRKLKTTKRSSGSTKRIRSIKEADDDFFEDAPSDQETAEVSSSNIYGIYFQVDVFTFSNVTRFI
jgi:hypothetical protein